MVSRSTTCVRRLGEFRRACVRSLSHRLGEVDAAVRDMGGRLEIPEAARQALGLLESLLASAGALGFGGICRAASGLKAVVRDCLEADPKDRPEMYRAAVVHLDELRRQADVVEARVDTPADPRPRTPVALVSGDAGLAESLAHYGYEVRRFGTIGEARDGSFTSPACALVVDPGDDGPDAALEAIGRDRTDGRPVLILTDRDGFPTRLEAVRAGVEVVFGRPGQIGGLIDRLGRMTAKAPSEPYRILLVDDDPVAAGLHAAALRSAGMVVRTVSDPLSVMEPLRETTPDLVLLDMDMGVCTGAELAAVIRQHDDFVGIPIVFVSSETGTSRQLAARSVGADDFLVKPVKPGRLAAEVALRVERSRTLRSHMIRDGQTGALSHTAFMMQLRLEVQRARRSGRRLALARVDVDRFRVLNERLGQEEGDRMIRDLARLLQKRLRSTDLVGRSGGDRFLVLLGDATGEAAQAVLEEIRRSFGKLRPSATLRAGVASFPCQPEAELLLDAAEKAATWASRTGGDCVELASE